MASLEQLQRELTDLTRQMDVHRHEAILRDEIIERRIASVTEDLATLTGNVGQIAKAVNHLLDQTTNLVQRMDQTDKRWNELIAMLSKEHGNGGKQ